MLTVSTQAGRFLWLCERSTEETGYDWSMNSSSSAGIARLPDLWGRSRCGLNRFPASVAPLDGGLVATWWVI